MLYNEVLMPLPLRKIILKYLVTSNTSVKVQNVRAGERATPALLVSDVCVMRSYDISATNSC